MNTKVVPFAILDVSKVYWCPYNHFIHWSYMIASISIHIKSTFHVIRYKNEMKFHMLMFMNVWMMLVLMKCKCQNAKLNTGVLQSPGRGFEAASPQICGRKACLVFSLPQTPLM